MLRGLKTFPLLDGYRGRPQADLDSLRDLVMRVGALAATHPAIAELDLNPVIATPDGALVVDARVRLEAPGPGAGVPVAQRLSADTGGHQAAPVTTIRANRDRAPSRGGGPVAYN